MQIQKHIKTPKLTVSKVILWLRLWSCFSSCIVLQGATWKALDTCYIRNVGRSWGFAQKRLKYWHVDRQAELLNALSQGRTQVDSELDWSLLPCQNLVDTERHDLFDTWTGDFNLYYHEKWKKYLKRNSNLYLATAEQPFSCFLQQNKVKLIVL